MTIQITYFVHSTTLDNELGLATGWRDVSLSSKGLREANELRAIAAESWFDRVYCSDLKRAIETATIVFGNRFQISTDRRLRECNYGDLAGTPASAFKADMAAHIDEPFPNGESYRSVELRISDFLNDVATLGVKEIAIVGHQAPQLAFEVLLAKKSWSQAIEQDWRRTGRWQPGWPYSITS